VELTL